MALRATLIAFLILRGAGLGGTKLLALLGISLAALAVQFMIDGIVPLF